MRAAATLGYAVALAIAVRRGNWLEARLVVVATLVFSLLALYDCAVAFATGAARPVVALVTGLPALLLPQPVGHLLGYRVTDVIVLTLAGAATCGYAAMGALELRSRHWQEMRLPVLMVMVFNAPACWLRWWVCWREVRLCYPSWSSWQLSLSLRPPR